LPSDSEEFYLADVVPLQKKLQWSYSLGHLFDGLLHFLPIVLKARRRREGNLAVVRQDIEKRSEHTNHYVA
jgi:hypothetical protein